MGILYSCEPGENLLIRTQPLYLFSPTHSGLPVKEFEIWYHFMFILYFSILYLLDALFFLKKGR